MYFVLKYLSFFSLKIHFFLLFSDNPEQKTKNKILDDFVSLIETSAAEQGTSFDDFLGQVTKRCRQKWVVEEKSKPSIAVEKATALMYNLDLSVNKYQESCYTKYHFIPIPPSPPQKNLLVL